MALITAAPSVACVSKKEINEARSSVYDTDFAIVYSETLAAVRDLYPNVDENPTAGTIKTAWHQVQFSSDADDPKAVRARDRAAGLDNPAVTESGLGGSRSLARNRRFIRFDVSVVGGRPWRVRVIGKASEWEPGNAVPVELRGAAVPHWLGGRTDALVVKIHERLTKFARPAPKEVAPLSEEPAVDLSAFGPIPAPAAQTVAAVKQALAGRDLAALRAQLSKDVVWSLGAEPGADAAMAMWQADPDALGHLAAAINAGCRSEGTAKVSCPPAASEQPGYAGWRVRFEPRGSVWKLTAFVQGE